MSKKPFSKVSRTMLAASMALSVLAAPITWKDVVNAEESIKFVDVKQSHWANKVIHELANEGLVAGIGGNKFGPELELTRAQFIVIVTRALDLPATEEETPFTDVPAWAARDIANAYAAGLVKGTSETKLDPNKVLTREEMITMLVRAYEHHLGTKIQSTETPNYKDMNQVSSWAKEVVSVAVEHGLINGKSATTLAPKDNTVRAEGAAVIHNLLKSSLVSVQLLGINDFHGQINTYKKVENKMAGGAEFLAAYLRQHEAENPDNTLKISAGDSVGASAPASALLQDEPTIEILNTLGFNVSTLGNHEFDEGVDEMLRLIFGGEHEVTGDFGGADFPYIAANVIEDETGEPLLDPYVIYKVGGVDVGFIGVVTTETPSIVIPSGVEGVSFTDEVEAINKYTAELKEQGVKSIVVVSHNPAESNTDGTNARGEVIDMANTIDDEVDVIYAGHNHKYTNTVVDNKLIVQSFSSGTAFSDIDLLINKKTGDIVKKSAEVINTFHEGIEPDAEIKAMVDAAYDQVKDKLNEVVGTAAVEITRDLNANGESLMGNLIADSMIAQTGTDLAFMNPGGVRASINQGEITWEELFTVQPFGNDLVTMELTGQQVIDLLNQQWATGTAKILQVSGLTFSYSETVTDGKVTGEVKEVKLKDGSPIDVDATYTATVNNFMATGGDGYTVLTSGANPVVNITDLDALINYVKAQETVEPKIEGRITKVTE
ncbi:5'-nucleotidase C-terminal domain-containing protein [Fictibacillus phosphorivorans]|uniref:5'-nucleotidase C-terminal domain-containing protein n=1 Tax=Fictibacillus phosphorivorans TaxID=1221500 RepID=UPI00203BD595|nr:5'-nucleotidase C-terminal domain-containing protein [Fictibacillus phosphorivorans]MCM3718529.1 5'-nucleotidase C-terminal domain-containing protein [Fictibacillus phosphorivorans]MCM3776115.1 5'-nucleotidase C-terminal domain-containing protein [Fictibacillus phosphorivorans]